jgi:sensor histidine kinase YesM
LDNAIEACAKINGEKTIDIVSEIKNNIWFLTIKNPVLRRVTIHNNVIITTKSDTSMHGFGLQNINQIVKHVGGRLNLSCSDKLFTLDVRIKLAASDDSELSA